MRLLATLLSIVTVLVSGVAVYKVVRDTRQTDAKSISCERVDIQGADCVVCTFSNVISGISVSCNNFIKGGSDAKMGN